LVDSGATHNFIDAQMVKRRGVTTKEFEGLSFIVLGDRSMQCTRYIPALIVTIQNYSMIDHFFVVDVSDTNMVMGIQWLYSLGWVTIDSRELEMELKVLDGKLLVLLGMHSYPPQTVSTHKMEAELRHGDIAAKDFGGWGIAQATSPKHIDHIGHIPSSVLGCTTRATT